MSSTRKMVLECTLGRMEKNTQDSGRTVVVMAKVK